MNHHRVPQQIPMAPQQAPTVPTSAPQLSPLLVLQGMIGNAGVLDLLRSQMPRSPRDPHPSMLPSAAQGALLQCAANPQAVLPSNEGLIAQATNPGGLATAAPGQASAPTRDDGTWWDGAVDWAVGGTEEFVDGAAGSLSAVPVLGDVAQGLADASRFQCDAAGGAAKAVGDMVGGIANMGLHPLQAAEGVGTMLEHIPFSSLKPLAGLYDVATGTKTIEESCAHGPLDDLGGDLDFWEGVGGALIDPYQKAIAEGKPGEAVGRGIVDIGSLFLDVGEVKAAGEAAEAAEAVSVLNKTDDAVKVASRVNDIGVAADDLARLGKTSDDLVELTGSAEEVVDLGKTENAMKGTQEIEKAGVESSETEDVASTGDKGEAASSSAKTPSGARYVEEADPKTIAIYDRIRKADDVAGIAEQLGVPEDVVSKVKDHLFEAEHELPVGPDQMVRGRFTPDDEIARLWEGASAGTLGPEDTLALKRLMSHEYVERGLMESGLPYRSPNPLAWEEGTNFPTRLHHGAHDLSPLVDPGRAPFGHLGGLLGGIPEGLTLSDDLTNLEDVIRLILEKKGGS